MFKDYCETFLSDPDSGKKIFFQDADHSYTYNDLIKSALSQAHTFHNSPDDFFALKIESSYKLFYHLIGAILAQKNVLILSHKEPDNAITRYQETIPFTRILTGHEEEVPLYNYQFPKAALDITRPAFFILSSGSSGPSKGIPLSLKNIYHSAMSFIDFFQMTSEMISFSNLPHHHIGGLMIFWRAFFSGSRVTVDPDADYDFISLVPLQLKRILDSGDTTKLKKLQHCTGVLIGGAPLDEMLKKSALDKHIRLFETYGMSETSSMVMLNGEALKGQEIKLDSENRFLIKGPTLSSIVPLDEDGFYHTKDVGEKNPDGTYSFKHRADLLFKSGGELIHPQLIEAKTKELEGITEAVVVPVVHPEWTHAAALIFNSHDESLSADVIKEHLKKHLHPHHLPRFIFKASGDLFKEGMKPKRFELQAWATEQFFKSRMHYLHIPHPKASRLMVFFHGFMEDHTDMIPLMDNHHETSFLFIDLPGHGKTSAAAFKSRDEVYSSLMDIINFYKKDLPLTLYGYSMGGRVALELIMLGLKHDCFFLESGHFGLATNEEKSARLAADRKLFSNHTSLPEFFESWYKNPIFAGYNQTAQFAEEIKKKLPHNPEEWQASLEFFSPGVFPYSQDEVIKKLQSQKIIGICGLEDRKYTEHFEDIQKSLPLFSINEIEHCGHNPHKTHLSEVKTILRLGLESLNQSL